MLKGMRKSFFYGLVTRASILYSFPDLSIPPIIRQCEDSSQQNTGVFCILAALLSMSRTETCSKNNNILSKKHVGV